MIDNNDNRKCSNDFHDAEDVLHNIAYVSTFQRVPCFDLTLLPHM